MKEDDTKKRKRGGDSSGKPKKKVVLDAPASRVSVSSVLRPDFSPPVVATSPGIEILHKLAFRSCQARDRSRTKSKNGRTKELLLHSTSHQSLDYTAREEGSRLAAPLLNHFVGIYDPKSGKLEVVEAKKMVVRGLVRAKNVAESSTGENEVIKTMMDRRIDLGQTFGTKKAKKAIRNDAVNAIAPEKKLGDGPAETNSDLQAYLQSVGDITTQISTKEELQSRADEGKPVPKANLNAQDIQDVYDPNSIIGAEILNLVPIREWQERARHGEGIQTASRFVACRVNAIATDNDATTRLRVLRYFNFVLIFYLSTRPGKQRGTRQVPPRDKLRELLSPAPEAVVENIRRKFSDAGVLRKFHIDLLMAHCCVYACIVDNFEVDIQTLRDDLRLDQNSINNYFRGIGGRVTALNKKAEGGHMVYLGRLKLPLDFPKLRAMAPRRK